MQVAGGEPKLQVRMVADFAFCSDGCRGDAQGGLPEGKRATRGVVNGMNDSLQGKSRRRNLHTLRYSGFYTEIGKNVDLADGAGPGGDGCAIDDAQQDSTFEFRPAQGLLRGLQ